MVSEKHHGLFRLSDVLDLIPVSPSAWHKGVKEGLYPQPVRIGKRSVAWRKSEILELIHNGINADGGFYDAA